MEDMGYTSFNLGPEPEFFLFKLDNEGNPTTEMNDEGGYFDLAPIDTSEDCRREIARTLEEIGFDVEMSHHEAGPRDRKSTRLNSSHVSISYAVFCLK